MLVEAKPPNLIPTNISGYTVAAFILFTEAVVDLHTLPPTPITRNPNPLPPPRRLRAPDPIQPDIVRKPINCPPLPVSTQEDAHAYTLPQRADSPEFDLDLIYITERIIGKLYTCSHSSYGYALL